MAGISVLDGELRPQALESRAQKHAPGERCRNPQQRFVTDVPRKQRQAKGDGERNKENGGHGDSRSGPHGMREHVPYTLRACPCIARHGSECRIVAATQGDIFFLARLVAREKTGAAMQIDTCIGRVA